MARGRRAVMAYDEFMTPKLFLSISEAAKELGVSEAGIIRCCQGTQSSCFGYKFEYFDDEQEWIPPKDAEFRARNVKNLARRRVNRAGERIIAVDLMNDTYRIYTSFSAMCRELEIDIRNAYRCLNHSPYHKTIDNYELFREGEIDLERLNGEW